MHRFVIEKSSMFYCRQRGFPAANQHPVTMGCIARLVVALLCATSACSALASPAWSALYGNAQYTAFVASDTTLPPAQWNVTWDASSAWLPAHVGGGGNLAAGTNGVVYVGMQAAADSSTIGVACFNATTGALVFSTPLPSLTGNSVIMVASDNMVVVVAPNMQGSVGAVVLDGTGAVVAKQSFAQLQCDGAGPQVTALSQDGESLFVLSSVSGTAAKIGLATLAVEHTMKLPSTSSCGGVFKAAGWSANSIDGNRLVYLTSCARQSLVILDMSVCTASVCPMLYACLMRPVYCLLRLQTGTTQYVSPTSEFVKTYSFDPVAGVMVMNWRDRIVAIEPTQSSTTGEFNVSEGWVAHDTMMDPVTGAAYIPMNWTSPAGVTALSRTVLKDTWSFTLPPPTLPETAFVQTVCGSFRELFVIVVVTIAACVTGAIAV